MSVFVFGVEGVLFVLNMINVWKLDKFNKNFKLFFYKYNFKYIDVFINRV